MKVKLYSYIGIGKYLGVSKFFSYGASEGRGAGPLEVNSETTGARKLKLKTQLDVEKYSLRVQNVFR